MSFEDECTKIQTDLIALCLEVTESKVDQIFAYASIEQKSTMFNAFFQKAGEVVTINQLGVDRKRAMEFLKTGTRDLEKVKAVCGQYGMKTPTEIKIYYDVKSGKYDADYQYEEICSAATGIGAGEVFMKWYESKKYGSC